MNYLIRSTNRFRFCLLAAACLAAGLLCGGQAPAQQAAPNGAADANPAPANAATSEDAAVVVATVNGDPILLSEVQQAAAAVLRQMGGGAAAHSALYAQVLNQVIDQRLIEAYLKRSGKAPSDAEVSAEVDRLKRKLQQEGSTYEKFLADRGMTDAALRERLVWNLGWPKFVKSELNDEALSKYFDAHRRQYDGGEVRASHILLRTEGRLDPAAVEEAVQRAAAIRQQIVDGKTTFEEAAARYSAGPSRLKGGDQGYFPRQGVMVESFADAAFRLEPGQISDPVLTPFGVHLIKVTDVKPGNLAWRQARQRIEADAARDLFRTVGDQERMSAKIEFTGKAPYLHPETGELIMPTQDDASAPPAAAAPPPAAKTE